MPRDARQAISISLLSGVLFEHLKLTVDVFELVSAPGGGRLLRLAGQWPDAAPAVTALDVSLGAHARSLTPLPGPPATNGTWRAAWALPHDIDTEGSTFSLILADGERVELPPPIERPIGDALRGERMQALVDAYAVARRERDAAVRAAQIAEATRERAVQQAEHARRREREQRAVADETRDALARAERALEETEHRAGAAEERLATARADIEERADAQRRVEARLGAALEVVARVER